MTRLNGAIRDGDARQGMQTVTPVPTRSGDEYLAPCRSQAHRQMRSMPQD
jgi:hypothetical protein